jgi:hypothetical protein
MKPMTARGDVSLASSFSPLPASPMESSDEGKVFISTYKKEKTENMPSPIVGLPHVTAIDSDPQHNLGFARAGICKADD